MEHNKVYKSDVEERFRMKIFMDNKHKIAKHNGNYEMNKVSYKLKMNKYGDMVSNNRKIHIYIYMVYRRSFLQLFRSTLYN